MINNGLNIRCPSTIPWGTPKTEKEAVASENVILDEKWLKIIHPEYSDYTVYYNLPL